MELGLIYIQHQQYYLPSFKEYCVTNQEIVRCSVRVCLNNQTLFLERLHFKDRLLYNIKKYVTASNNIDTTSLLPGVPLPGTVICHHY